MNNPQSTIGFFVDRGPARVRLSLEKSVELQVNYLKMTLLEQGKWHEALELRQEGIIRKLNLTDRSPFDCESLIGGARL